MWSSLTAGIADLVTELGKGAKYAFLALRTEDEDEEFRIVKTTGTPPANLAENQKLVRGSFFPLLLRSGHCFGIAGKSRHSGTWMPEPAQIWALGLLWEIETSETHNDRLLSNLFHEIRNPICGILNTTNLLLNNTALPASFRPPISLIEESTSGLLQLSGDLLDMHRLKRGLTELKLQPVQLRKCFQSVVDLLHDPLTFQVRLAIHSQVPETLLADEGRLRQILLNLLTNSQKYGSHTATIRVAWQPPKLYVEVEDAGHGIPKSEFGHIFRLQTNSESGLGIGLLMCKKLLKLMKGNIFVKRSELNEGTTMAFFFEAEAVAAPVSAELPVPAPPPKYGLEDVKVLIADDNRAVRESFREMVLYVAGAGIIVDLAENGVEAVLKQEERNYDVIFMDLRMPQMRGFEAIFQILMGKSPRPAFIFVVSAYALSSTEKDVCQQWELSGFIQKPFKLEDLRHIFLRVQAFVAEKRTLSKK